MPKGEQFPKGETRVHVREKAGREGTQESQLPVVRQRAFAFCQEKLASNL